jgi:putative ABC transport system substrate-binding protein
MNRSILASSCLLLTVLLIVVSVAEAQRPGKIPRIGYLSSSGNPFGLEAFPQALRTMGYIDGQNIVIEARGAEAKPERIPGLVAELIELKVDILVSTAQPALERAKQPFRS